MFGGDPCVTETYWLSKKQRKFAELKRRLNETDFTPIDDRQRAPASSRGLFQDAYTLETFRVQAARIQYNRNHNHNHNSQFTIHSHIGHRWRSVV